MLQHPTQQSSYGGHSYPGFSVPPNSQAEGDTLTPATVSHPTVQLSRTLLPRLQCPTQQSSWGHSNPGFSVLYNPIVSMFKTPEMGPGILTLSSACFSFVSKQQKHSDFMFQSIWIISLYIIPFFQCFETQEMGPGVFAFSRFCFIFISKRMKCLDCANFFHVSIHFNNFPI